MQLDEEQKSILKGEAGQVMSLAMRTLVSYGESLGAGKLTPVKSAHLSGSFGIAPFSAYFIILERFVKEGIRVKVPTTVNPRPGRELSMVNRYIFKRQGSLEACYERIGVTPNYTCVCYNEANAPAKGDILGWAESSAVQYANSVLGARTNKNSLMIDLCSAVTGLTPEFGYLLDENRRGKLLVQLNVKSMDASGLGYLIGKAAVESVPVIEHYPFSRTELKNMGGAMAASGAVSLFHVEGLTPEAPDLKSVFDGRPEATITISQDDLDTLRGGNHVKAGLVVFGCPQMTSDEAEEIASRFSGKRSGKQIWFCMVPEERRKFEVSSTCEKAKNSGVSIYEHCPLAALSVRLNNKTVMTNSGKLYYYLAGTEYGTTEDCLRACGVI